MRRMNLPMNVSNGMGCQRVRRRTETEKILFQKEGSMEKIKFENVRSTRRVFIKNYTWKPLKFQLEDNVVEEDITRPIIFSISIIGKSFLNISVTTKYDIFIRELLLRAWHGV